MVDLLHPDEMPIDERFVQRLLTTQLPQFCHLPIRAVTTQGTDNVIFRLGAELSVRLPRKSAVVRSLLIEREWLPRLAASLPLSVPVPVASGDPSPDYPFPWMVCTWVTGEPAVPDGFGAEGAQLLGDFVSVLQSLDTDHGPVVEPGQRAGPVGPYDGVARAALKAALGLAAAGRIEPTLIDENAAIDVWEAAVEAPAWPGPDVWVHRDLMGANLLAMNGRLTGVIDFGGLAVGDPAGNVMGAFHVVQAEHRPTFRAIVAADDATWARARGWALTQGLEALPYYLDTHPGMVAMARHVISSALAG